MTEWKYTRHARERMHARRIEPALLEQVLNWPDMIQPDPKRQEGVRLYVGDGITASVAEDSRTVLTVGIHGASRNDWESFVRPLEPETGERAMPATTTRAQARRTRRPRAAVTKAKAQPVASRNVLDDVHPGIAKLVRREMRARGLTFRNVRVESRTVVTLLVT